MCFAIGLGGGGDGLGLAGLRDRPFLHSPGPTGRAKGRPEDKGNSRDENPHRGQGLQASHALAFQPRRSAARARVGAPRNTVAKATICPVVTVST